MSGGNAPVMHEQYQNTQAGRLKHMRGHWRALKCLLILETLKIHGNPHVLSPVNQNGSFEFDRVIKSGTVVKRTRKTKASILLRPPYPSLTLLSSNGSPFTSSYDPIFYQSTKTRRRPSYGTRLVSPISRLSRGRRTQRRRWTMCLVYSPQLEIIISAPQPKKMRRSGWS